LSAKQQVKRKAWRMALATGAMLAAGFAMLAWLWVADRDQTVASQAAARTRANAQSPAASAHSTASFPWSRTPGASAAESDAVPAKLGLVEICGHGQFDLNSPAGWAKVKVLQLQLVRDAKRRTEQLREALQRGDANARLANSLLELDDISEMQRDKNQGNVLTASGQAAWAQVQNQWFDLAQTDNNPTAWMFLAGICDGHSQKSSNRHPKCASFSADEWVRRFPKERRAWAALADARAASGDASGALDAMRQATQVGMTLHDPLPLLLQASSAATKTIKDTTPDTGADGQLQARLRGAAGGYVSPMGWLQTVCNAKMAQEPDRREACLGIKKAIEQESNQTVDWVAVKFIAKNAQLPVAEQRAIQARMDAHSAWVFETMNEIFGPNLGMSCDVWAAQERQTKSLIEHGELGTMKRDLERWGLSEQALLDKRRGASALPKK
jgi:hypothetical protein